MQRPEYFVLRIYRRDDAGGRTTEGVVEVVASGKQFAFAGADELWRILENPSDELEAPPAD